MEIKEIKLSNSDLNTVKGLYLKHHVGNCFDERFNLEITGDKTLKVHSAIDVNDVFQFAFHELNVSNSTSEISWNRKSNRCIRFFR